MIQDSLPYYLKHTPESTISYLTALCSRLCAYNIIPVVNVFIVFDGGSAGGGWMVIRLIRVGAEYTSCTIIPIAKYMHPVVHDPKIEGTDGVLIWGKRAVIANNIW